MDIKALAEQAGIGFLADPEDSHYCGDGLQRFADLVVEALLDEELPGNSARAVMKLLAAERERCTAWCSVSDSDGFAAHHIKAGTPAPK